MAASAEVGGNYIVFCIELRAVKVHKLRAADIVHDCIICVFAHGGIFKVAGLIKHRFALCVKYSDARGGGCHEAVADGGVALVRSRPDIKAFDRLFGRAAGQSYAQRQYGGNSQFLHR